MLLDILVSGQQDAVLWKAAHILSGIDKTKPRKLAEAIVQVTDLLLAVEDDVLRQGYINQIADNNDIDQSLLEKKMDTLSTTKEKSKKKEIDTQQHKRDEDYGYLTPRIPDDALDEYYTYRFFERRNAEMTGLWFPRQDGNYERLTNFIVTPLFHLKSPEKNVRLVELYGYDPIRKKNFTSLVEMPSSELLKKDQFACRVFDEGPYNVEPAFSNAHLSRINKKISFEFRKAYELLYLGWQPEGFWAFANKAWKDGLHDYDKYGIVTLNDRHYYSPSASTIAHDERDTQDLHDNDKKHSFMPSDVNLQQWSKMVAEVYGENGWAMIGFAFVTVFLDIVKKCTQMPLFYPYGAVESGKSTLGESLSALFFQDLKAFNLSTASTDYAFFNLVERYCNCPVQFNEFDENGIKEEWFKFFKALFDDETRERGRGIKGKTHKQKVNTSIVIMGQYLSTKDDNSVLSRAIPCLVKRKEFTPKEVEQFNELKTAEKKGLSSIIIELLQHRDHFKSVFYETLVDLEKEFRSKLQKANMPFKNRTLKSYATLSAAIKILSKKVSLPFTYDQYQTYCIRRISEISSLMAESNTLSEFWKMLEYLVDKEVIFEGADFKVLTENTVTILVDRDKFTKKFNEPTKIIYIRLNSIFREYSRAVQQTTKGKALNEQTLITYLKEQAYYVGLNPGTNFKMSDGSRKNTSAYALRYDDIGANLERVKDNEDNRQEETFTAWVYDTVKTTTLHDKFMFTVRNQIEIPSKDGIPNQVETRWTTCFIDKSDRAEKDLTKDSVIKIHGLTSTNPKGRRSMDVLSYTTLIEENEQQTPPPADLPF
jgi:hypothetical protein